MIIVQVISPQYSKADNSTINCMVKFSTGGLFPYTATAVDNTDYGIQLWADLNAGKYGAIAPYQSS